nr:MOG IG-2' [Macaca fascicularis]
MASLSRPSLPSCLCSFLLLLLLQVSSSYAEIKMKRASAAAWHMEIRAGLLDAEEQT